MRQVIPASAEGAYLDRWCRLVGLTSKHATAAGGAMVFVNTVVIVQSVFDLAQQATAWALAAFGVGSMTAAVVLPRILNRLKDRTAMLMGAGIMSLVPQVVASLNNALPHGFSEILYAATSAGANNGSAFGGLNANTPFLNVLLSVLMLAGRFVPIAAILAIAQSMADKKTVAASAGTLSTCNGMFVFLLVFVVLLVGALSFFPALALGPVAEHLQMAR